MVAPAQEQSAPTRGPDQAGVLVRQITTALTAAGHTVVAAESLTGGRRPAVRASGRGPGVPRPRSVGQQA